MPPKNRFSRQEIVDAALSIARSSGFAAVTARAVAEQLGSSPKVIFGLFPDMEALKAEVLRAAEALYSQRIAAAMAAGAYPPYKASGMAYIAFARDEKQLFRLLFMRDRTGEPLGQDPELLKPILEVIQRNTGLSEEEAFRFHLKMWVCVHGIAAMIATGYLNWDTALVSDMVSDIYLAARSRLACEKE